MVEILDLNAVSQEGNWTVYRKGKSVIYVQQVTYAGSTVDINLDFSKAVQLNRVDEIWNDATAKDLDLRMYVLSNSAYYSSLNRLNGNTDTSIIDPFGIEYKFPAGSRLQAHYANYTVGKILTIIVQVDEL